VHHNRTGYHCAFYRRPEVLQTLHKYIKDKNKVLVNKRVCNIEYQHEKLIVLCKDGSKHIGDIVVGCDGVHSAVRKEMWRLTDLNEPGKVPLSDKDCTPLLRILFASLTYRNSFNS
jgi:2-polyprenyl-6-methoxyphenol hydroxylase-like FAD-dependent oxidoreductase